MSHFQPDVVLLFVTQVLRWHFWTVVCFSSNDDDDDDLIYKWLLTSEALEAWWTGLAACRRLRLNSDSNSKF